MKISVAMCTYNGARFLGPQLDSLVSQARQPDEVVICDDQSEDETLTLVERWAGTVPFKVQIHVNPGRMGSIRNFDKAISHCSGDLIALCDQDDVWLDHKLGEAETAFRSQPELGVWFTDALLVDEQLRTLSQTLWEKLSFDSRLQGKVRGPGAFSILLGRSLVTGATMVFPRRFTGLVQPIPSTLRYFIHDRWIATIIAAVAPLQCSTRPSMLYRQHPGQQLGVADRPSLAETLPARLSRKPQPYLDDLTVSEALHERLCHSGAYQPRADALASLDERIRILMMRTQLPGPRWRRLVPIAASLLNGRYHRQARGIASALKDLVL
jgi:hypothetical protein